MASKTFAAALLATLMASVVTVGGVFAHGDDNEYRNPGYGMRDDQGMGPGMMDGYGMGPGMMGGPMYGFELNSAQRKQIARIDTESEQTGAGRLTGQHSPGRDIAR